MIQEHVVLTEREWRCLQCKFCRGGTADYFSGPSTTAMAFCHWRQYNLPLSEGLHRVPVVSFNVFEVESLRRSLGGKPDDVCVKFERSLDPNQLDNIRTACLAGVADGVTCRPDQDRYPNDIAGTCKYVADLMTAAGLVATDTPLDAPTDTEPLDAAG